MKKLIVVCLAAVAMTVAAHAQALAKGPVIEKALTYDQHTLTDTYPYKGGTREFQFEKMRARLAMLDSIQQPASRSIFHSRQAPVRWGILQNRRNEHGEAALVKDHVTDEYHAVADRYGVERYQSVALYVPGETVPERYGRDGSLVKLLGMNADSTTYRVECYNAPGMWEVVAKFVKPLAGGVVFDKVVMVDRTNQDIATLERADSGSNGDGAGGKWLVRSMNPCTTGEHTPPVAYPTPVGMFVIQNKLEKMMYNNGGAVIVGFAPWASRFTNGAYLHGVPVNNPNGAIVEFSPTLGTIPRSHECVRNASSHAKFIYDWAPVEGAIVFVYD